MTRLRIDFEGATKEQVRKVLTTTFGVKNFSFVDTVAPEPDAIVERVDAILKEISKDNSTVAFRTKRSDKKFPIKSPDLNAMFGERANKHGLKVDYSGATQEIRVEITRETAYIFRHKEDGPGGLPVGTAGKVLCLFSGGVDSVVAAYLLQKRGCRVDFLHLHVYHDNKEVLGTKIKTMIDNLNAYQHRAVLHAAPYFEYQLRTVGAIPQELDLVGFKHFILRVAEKVALEQGYGAIVTGDALAQVASQTLENIQTQRAGISVPIFSPLIGNDKQEIVDLSNRIGVFVPGDYKDCCSIVSKNPATRAKPHQLRAALEKVPFDDVIAQTVAQMTSFNIPDQESSD